MRSEIMMLIGSAKCKEKFLEVEKEYTFKGFIVLLPFWHGMTHKESYSHEEWELLLGYAYKKIDLVDIVFVINCKTEDCSQGYIGEHTKKEIFYARRKGKKVVYLNPPSGFQESKE